MVNSFTGNMLIHGDNLLALKALEQDFAGKVRCIYIDPPYNTGNAFEHYDDGLEHSIWLSLIKPRIEMLHRLLSSDGTDQGGISKAVNWQGGGGFKYYYLVPSLLKEDKHGNWIIDERYNADMLAAAMAKQEGFKYNPDETHYWKQGRSTEKDFIFTTTNFITVEHLDKIHEEMRPDDSLLICCKSFQQACENRYLNITIKKIPKILLGRSEFGKEDYSLNIVSMPLEEKKTDLEPAEKTNANKKKGKTQAIGDAHR